MEPMGDSQPMDMNLARSITPDSLCINLTRAGAYIQIQSSPFCKRVYILLTNTRDIRFRFMATLD